jgi:tripartite-type tricarboxylate transporter receptor subunit TctC
MPFPAGNSSDLAVRFISKEAEKFLGQPITVVNKPGASGTIGAAALATAKPDGYTIGHLGSSGLFIVPYMENVPYHPVKDFTFIMQFGAFNMGVVVKADSQFKTFKDLIEYARQNPKKLTFGTNGTNSVQHILMDQICKREKVEMTHIPFKGGSEVENALLGGHVLCGVGDFSYSLVEAKLSRLVLILRQEISAEYPDVPSMKDLGYEFWEPAVLNVSAPKGLPEAMVRRLEDAFMKAMKEPGFIEGMKNIHMPVYFRNGKDLTSYVAYNYELWGRFLKERGLAK